jgi:polysaccharide biosynthesis transport protein
LNVHLPPVRSNEKLPTPAGRSGPVHLPYGREGLADQIGPQNYIRLPALEYLWLMLKHKYLVCALCGLSLFGGLILAVVTPKTYHASTIIKIDIPAQLIIKRRNLPGFKSDPKFYNTQYELIKSRELADRVATELNLGETEFVGKPSVSLLDRLLGRQTTDTTARDAAALKDRHDQAVDQIMRGLSVQPVLETSIVRIRYASSSPEWAQRISLGVAEQFGKMTLDMRFSASNYARHFLEERLQELKIKLETSEKQLIEYAQSLTRNSLCTCKPSD